MICPWKPKANWFLKLRILAIQQSVGILSYWSTMTDLAEAGMVPSILAGEVIKFTAWLLEGKDVNKLENCPVGLSKLYSRAGRRALKRDMNPTGSTATLPSWNKLPSLQ